MTTFARKGFNAASYAAFRPTYPPSLYNAVLQYHHGPRKLLVDLGCGTGIATRYMAKHFDKVIGCEPSASMISKAQDQTPNADYINVTYKTTSAESLPFLDDGTVDMVIAAQAAHWFDFSKTYPELKRVLRKDGTIAFWVYKDHVYIGHPKATQILLDYCYGPDPDTQLGPHWEPGRAILRDKIRSIKPPNDDFTDIQRIEYEPDVKGKNAGEGQVFVERQMTVAQSMGYLRTFSSFHEWARLHPEQVARENGGKGDLVDRMYDDMKEAEGWTDDLTLDLVWGSALLLFRNR